MRTTLARLLTRATAVFVAVSVTTLCLSLSLFDPGRPLRVIAAVACSPQGRQALTDVVADQLLHVQPQMPPARARRAAAAIVADPVLLQALTTTAPASPAGESARLIGVAAGATRRIDPALSRQLAARAAALDPVAAAVASRPNGSPSTACGPHRDAGLPRPRGPQPAWQAGTSSGQAAMLAPTAAVRSGDLLSAVARIPVAGAELSAEQRDLRARAAGPLRKASPVLSGGRAVLAGTVSAKSGLARASRACAGLALLCGLGALGVARYRRYVLAGLGTVLMRVAVVPAVVAWVLPQLVLPRVHRPWATVAGLALSAAGSHLATVFAGMFGLGAAMYAASFALPTITRVVGGLVAAPLRLAAGWWTTRQAGPTDPIAERVSPPADFQRLGGPSEPDWFTASPAALTTDAPQQQGAGTGPVVFEGRDGDLAGQGRGVSPVPDGGPSWAPGPGEQDHLPAPARPAWPDGDLPDRGTAQPLWP